MVEIWIITAFTVGIVASLLYHISMGDMGMMLNLDSIRLIVLGEKWYYTLGAALLSTGTGVVGVLLLGTPMTTYYLISVGIVGVTLLYHIFGFPGIFKKIDSPELLSIEEAEEELSNVLDGGVIGVELNGESRAYPVSTVCQAHVVNDELGGEHIAVTHCGLCNSSHVFYREFDGRRITLKPTTSTIESNLVLHDDHEGYWHQISGDGIWGWAKGKQLPAVDFTVTSWKKWKTNHPDTKVIKPDFSGISKIGSVWFPKLVNFVKNENYPRLFPVSQNNDELPPKETVIGIHTTELDIAIPRDEISAQIDFNFKHQGSKYFFFFDPATDETNTFIISRPERNLQLIQSEGKTVITDEIEIWDMKGTPIKADQPLEKGKTIHPVFWFGWYANYPETKVLRNLRQSATIEIGGE